MTNESPTALYIDDDADLARLVQRGLKRQGFVVEHARDGESGPCAHPRRAAST